MSLRDALHEIIRGKGLTPSNLPVDRAGHLDRATLYRILSGETPHPRVRTLVGICGWLDVTPSEVLELGGLWVPIQDATDPLPAPLRRALSRAQALAPARKRLALDLMLYLTGVLEEQTTQGELPPAP